MGGDTYMGYAWEGTVAEEASHWGDQPWGDIYGRTIPEEGCHRGTAIDGTVYMDLEGDQHQGGHTMGRTVNGRICIGLEQVDCVGGSGGEYGWDWHGWTVL